MNIMAVGDVTGDIGCNHLRQVLPQLKKDMGADMVIVNGENSAERNGISRASADHIFTSGADVITTGNHAFRRHGSHQLFDETEALIRPANWAKGAPGKGFYLIDKGFLQVCIINVLGVVYMESMGCPFECIDEILPQVDMARIIIIDMHAEATAEKKALAYYLDGRVSAIFGTHTHVQTADEQILPNGTGFISDIGMTGPIHSVIGIRPELSIRKIKNKLPVMFEVAEGKCVLQGVVMNIDEKTGKCIHMERISVQ